MFCEHCQTGVPIRYSECPLCGEDTVPCKVEEPKEEAEEEESSEESDTPSFS